MAINKDGVDEKAVEEAIAHALEEFYTSLLANQHRRYYET